MLVRFWGTRGSLPTPLRAEAVREKIIQAVLKANGRSFDSEDEAARFVDEEMNFAERGTYGGDSSCVEIEGAGDEFIVCDMGSGLRRLGIDSFRRMGEGKPKVFNFFMSHLHWDHIKGFPFFGPAFVPGVTINVYGGHEEMETALRRQ